MTIFAINPAGFIYYINAGEVYSLRVLHSSGELMNRFPDLPSFMSQKQAEDYYTTINKM